MNARGAVEFPLTMAAARAVYHPRARAWKLYTRGEVESLVESLAERGAHPELTERDGVIRVEFDARYTEHVMEGLSRG